MRMFIYWVTLLGCLLPALYSSLSVEASSLHGIRADPPQRLIERPDDQDLEDKLILSLFGKPLALGGELEAVSDYLKDSELEDTADDDRWRLEQQLQIELLLRPATKLILFLEGEIRYELDLYAEDEDRNLAWAFERGETWLFIGDVLGSPFSLQVGRQEFRDTREWWWDENLDALRIRYDRHHLHMQIAIAQQVAPLSPDDGRIDPEEDDVLRLLGHVAWKWSERLRVEGFYLYQHDRSSQPSVGAVLSSEQQDATDADLSWVGVRVLGTLSSKSWGELRYRIDAAVVVGEEVMYDFDRLDDRRRRVSERQPRDVLGWGMDLSVSWYSDLPWHPVLTLGYAVGSGDADSEGNTEHAFQQTGLQSNNGFFGGVNDFAYYGALLDPELSNLHIWTVALGFRIVESSSIELVYHLYQQVNLAPFLRDVDIDADPEGDARHIGQEWDLVFGLEAWEHVEIELIGAIFRAGSAFGQLNGELAYRVLFEIKYSF